MAKPAPRRVQSDDCELTVDGATYRPHEGEWIEVRGGRTVAESEAIHDMHRVMVDLDAASGEPDEAQRVSAIMHHYYERMIGLLADRLLAWSWTDDDGEPLPQPHHNPSVFYRLTDTEAYYLLSAIRGETPGERKNG